MLTANTSFECDSACAVEGRRASLAREEGKLSQEEKKAGGGGVRERGGWAGGGGGRGQ